MKRLQIAFFILLVVLVGGYLRPARTFATEPPVIVVGNDGAWQDLQAALDAAPEGAIVEVSGGTYTGPIEITKPLTLRGINRPVIDGLQWLFAG